VAPTIDVNAALDIARSALSAQRLRHSLGVAEVAARLARQHGADPERAQVAGLLHDYARDLGGARLLGLAAAEGLLTEQVEEWLPDLLHGPVGAWLLRAERGVRDEAVLSAIAKHTLADPVMSPLDKIVYLADMIEPGREYPGREEIAVMASCDLDAALLAGLDTTIRYCLERKRYLHPRTVVARNHLLRTLPSGRGV
jgi:predicted HD superfamily hydrolase involved in NAD metabolism